MDGLGKGEEGMEGLGKGEEGKQQWLPSWEVVQWSWLCFVPDQTILGRMAICAKFS